MRLWEELSGRGVRSVLSPEDPLLDTRCDLRCPLLLILQEHPLPALPVVFLLYGGRVDGGKGQEKADQGCTDPILRGTHHHVALEPVDRLDTISRH